MQEHHTSLALLTRFSLCSGAVLNSIHFPVEEESLDQFNTTSDQSTNSPGQAASPFEATGRFLRTGRRFPVLLFAAASARSLVAFALDTIDAVLPRTAIALPVEGEGSIRCVVPVHAVLSPNRIAW